MSNKKYLIDISLFEPDKIGLKIKQIKNDKKLKSVEMAQILEMAPANYSKLEKGEKITLQRLYILCLKLNVNLNWLVSGIGDMYIDIDFIKKVEQERAEFAEFREVSNKMESYYNDKVIPSVKVLQEDVMTLKEQVIRLNKEVAELKLERGK
jgi:DNA-binding Xre family transcriptional regulator